MQQPSDRRPVSSRDWRAIRHAAQWLIDRRAAPNAISVAGMVAALAAGALVGFAPEWRLAWLLAAALIVLRLLANVLDGMVALGRGVASPVGELYNEVPDRVSDTAVLAGFGYAAHDPALGWAAALLAMSTACIRTTARAAGAPSDFRGPMAKQQRMALAIAVCLCCAALPAWRTPLVPAGLWIVVAGSALTALRRLAAAAAALRRA